MDRKSENFHLDNHNGYVSLDHKKQQPWYTRYNDGLPPRMDGGTTNDWG